MRNPSGMCMCGCEGAAPRAKESRRGYKRGEALMFIRGHSSRKQDAEYVVDENGCWIWQRARTATGHGHLQRGGKWHMAYRWHYENLHGPIPKGRELHHVCGTPECVNPAHLEPVTRREHMVLDGRRAFGRYPLTPKPGES